MVKNKVAYPCVGIDYSMTCPAMCVHTGDKWSIENCQLFYLTNTKKYVGNFNYDKIHGYILNEYKNQEERFNFLSSFFLAIIDHLEPKPEEIGIEGYAMGARGMVFAIAENTGILKHKLWKAKFPIISFAPTSVKKFATGTGRADKNQMYDAFLKETRLDLKTLLCYDGEKIGSPIGDIVDAYYVCKYNFFMGVKPE